MCGIVAQLALDGSPPVDRALLEVMRDTMAHRGPDGSGVWCANDGRLGMAHRRLAIIDLSAAAAQPMHSVEGRYSIVFNGEIYNHAEIRRELESLGVRDWQTNHSDTEVILHAVREWGVSALRRFRGMFAFALWDTAKQELLVVRDRIGVKPLYFAIDGGRFTCASEIKAILATGIKRRVNVAAFYHYLTFLSAPGSETMFEGISKLEPGCMLRVRSDGTVKCDRWYDVWAEVTPWGGTEAQVSERVLAELKHSVALRGVSDVPVGVLLSGGVDSTTNAALFSAQRGSQVKSFSVGYDSNYDSYANELDFARDAAAYCGTEHHELRLSQEDLFGFLPRMIELQDEPLGDPVCVPVYFVSKLARENGVVVVQVGEGADELFWGYPSWKKRLALQHALSLPGGKVASKLASALFTATGKTSPLIEAVRRHSIGQPVFWGGVDAFTEVQKRRLLSTEANAAVAGLSTWDALEPLWARFQATAWEPSALHWMTFCDLSIRLPELLLMRVDKMGMGASIEGRVPFLDHKFVELVLGLSSAAKTAGGRTKTVLKSAVRGVIPDFVIDRPKQGFGVPIYEWFLDRLGTSARLELYAFAEESNLVNRAAIDVLFEQRAGPQLWYLLNVALWWRRFIAEESLEGRLS